MSNFPPIEEIDQDISTSQDGFQEDDFLAREKAVLGDEANAFAAEDSTETKFPEVDQIPDSIPGQVQSGVITESAMPYMPGQPDLVTQTKQQLSLDDSEPIKEWKARQELEIQRRDEFSETKKNETRDKAKKSIDDFYENYNAKRDDLVESTEKESTAFLEERDNTLVGGTTWDKISKIVDSIDREVRGGAKDKSRFKEILSSLQGDEKAPGAAGY